MSNYRQYADRANAAFLEARGQYLAAWNAYKAAEKELSDFKESARFSRYDPSVSRGDAARKQTVLEARYEEAAAVFNGVHGSVFSDFLTAFTGIEKEFFQEYKAEGADPAAIDNNALVLLNSGIMEAADYEEMLNRFQNNTTMLRLVRKYALEKSNSDTCKAEDRYVLNSVAAKAEEIRRGTKEHEWKQLREWAELCSGNRSKPVGFQEPEYVISVAGMWENRTGSIIENF